MKSGSGGAGHRKLGGIGGDGNSPSYLQNINSLNNCALKSCKELK